MNVFFLQYQRSVYDQDAWNVTTGGRNQCFLTQFLPEQPELNLYSTQVQAELEVSELNLHGTQNSCLSASVHSLFLDLLDTPTELVPK